MERKEALICHKKPSCSYFLSEKVKWKTKKTYKHDQSIQDTSELSYWPFKLACQSINHRCHSGANVPKDTCPSCWNFRKERIAYGSV